MYKKTTPIFGIPYLSKGERIESSEEEKRALMLDNLLFAGISGVPKVLFQDGDYDVFQENNSSYSVIITPNLDYSLLGIVNYRLVKVKETIIFEDIPKGDFYFIYACYQPELDVDATKIHKLVTTSRKMGNYHILLATLDLRNDKPILNDMPDGKQYSKDFLQHIVDNDNPHGKELHQDRLIIHDYIQINNNQLYEEYIVESFFNGKEGQQISIPKTPVYASLMPLIDNYGIYWFEINTNENFIKVYNTGQKGGKFILNVKVK